MINMLKKSRCVGSVPNVPRYDAAGMRVNQYNGAYTGTYKDLDNNYTTDWEQMCALNIQNIGTVYWLASRNAGGVSGSYPHEYFYMRIVDAGGSLTITTITDLYRNADYYRFYATQFGLRGVFQLKSEVKVTGGQGTESDPYQLGV